MKIFTKRYPRDTMRCDICKRPLLTVKDIGFVKICKGAKVRECRKCHKAARFLPVSLPVLSWLIM